MQAITDNWTHWSPAVDDDAIQPQTKLARRLQALSDARNLGFFLA
jgi:hypothetical protein